MSETKKVKIVLKSAGIKKLLRSPEIEAALMEVGKTVQGRAGNNFRTFAFRMPSRSVVRVSAINAEGKKENADNNVLLQVSIRG